MEHNKEILELIKVTAWKYIADAEVFLFGSRARKDAYPDSDYDILLITAIELDPRQKLPLKTRIRKELLQSGIRSDILIQSREEIKKKKRLPGHIIKNILKEAILL
ncbi:MAG TPA: nucleotidyltransferase domain-containing protein [Bacteroidales bacterium]|jgi:predicted nucleotidyltransferase|nr:nucleotidyltransferase domain-containing protein [Bacteroidales bacterium]